MSNSLWSHRLEPARLHRPWHFSGKHTVVDYHSLLQGIFSTQGSNPGLLHCRQILYFLSHQGSPVIVCKSTQSLQSCSTLCNHMDCSPPASSIHGILQARILEWFAIPSSRGRHEPLRKSQLSMKVKSLSRVRLFAVPWTVGFSVYGIFQAKVLEWVPLPSPNCTLGRCNLVNNLESAC